MTRTIGDYDALAAFLPNALIVLDWNGTTVDDAIRTRACLNAALGPFGVGPFDEATFSAKFMLPMEAMMAGLGVAPEQVDAAVKAWNDEISDYPAPLAPGAERLFRELHREGRPGGVISAAHTYAVAADAERLGIRDWLRFMIGDAQPKSIPLRDLVALGEGPVIYAGDTEYDITEAIAAGAIPVGYAGGYRPAEALLAAGALAVIDDLGLLLPPG
jgi:phosphoglycolate phosphatase-like HAD superfamily hydrolase